jgi:hypothetical protein
VWVKAKKPVNWLPSRLEAVSSDHLLQCRDTEVGIHRVGQPPGQEEGAHQIWFG